MGAALLAAVFVSATAVAAETSPAIVAAQKKVQASRDRFEAAKQKQEKTRTNAEALEHRIAALKRLREKSVAGADTELTSLLRESVAADNALRADARDVDRLEAEVRRSIAEAIVAIDTRIKELMPRLYQGELEMGSKQAIARNITELVELRKELGRTAQRLRVQPAIDTQWKKYDIQIDPLDGPKDLREKEDFLEDMRDRFAKKRDALKKAIKTSREDQALSHAARNFQTDTKLFDEESTRDRVLKPRVGQSTQNKTPESAVVGGTRDTPPQQPAPPPQSPTEQPTTDFNTDPSPNPAGVGQDRTSGDVAGGGDPGHSAIPTTQLPQLTKQLDLNALLNLSVDALDAASPADLAALEALAGDLDKLDAFLRARADELHRRAEQLKQDEARARAAQH